MKQEIPNPSSSNPSYIKPLIQHTTVSSTNLMVHVFLASPFIENFSKVPLCLTKFL